MDDNRKQELYQQLKSILTELKEDTVPVSVVEQFDDGILRICMKDTTGAREKFGG